MNCQMDSPCSSYYKYSSISTNARLLIGLIMLSSIIFAAVLTYNMVTLKYDWVNVHLIPHTHDDVGWLKTPEAYYEHYVKFILNHVIHELHLNPTRKFVYVETYFFWRWWQEQPIIIKNIVKCLIANKQLEIVGGGWCMSDEAVVHYQSFIDQSTWGFRILNDTFGPATCPTVAWQIDTFGHSKGIASLLSQMGFNSLFFARVDYIERKFRKRHKLMEFLWTGSKNLGESSTIFTSIFYDHYSAPKGFDFESQTSQSSIDFKGFADYARTHAKSYRTGNIIVPMGDDFRYFNARKYFKKMDELIRFFDENPSFKLRVFYSTPSIYVQHLVNADISWPEKHGDFFPYASGPHEYWTGYFTSRPTLKQFERISNNFLQICKQLLVFSNKGMEYFKELTSLREAVGVLQHHDAVTGTSQQHVTNHYAKLLYEGIKSCEKPVDKSLGKISFPREKFKRPLYKSCLLLNISVCELTEHATQFIVTVYNPLSRLVDHYARFPVKANHYTVKSSDGQEVRSQIVPIPRTVRNIPGRVSTAKMELIFKAVDIPAMGFKSYYVFAGEAKAVRVSRTASNPPPKKGVIKNFKLVFDQGNKLGVRSKKGNISLSQTMKYYKSTPHVSGAYLFDPSEDIPVSIREMVNTKLVSKGELVKEYEQTFSSWASQIIRIYKDEEYIEFEWLVGPIPVHDFIGKEVTLHYRSDIKNKNIFYTDVNGLEMEKRVKDYFSWREKKFRTIAGNYYPVTTMISIKDDVHQIYVIVDRPQGGSSLRNGEIELMVHRRMCYDDGKGVDEALNETVFGVGLVARGHHWIFFGEPESHLDQNAKLFAQAKHSHPWLFFLDASSLTFDQWCSNYVTEFSGLKTYVPRNIRILTLEPWREDTILLRLEHLFDNLPEPQLATTEEKIDLKHLFKNIEIIEARETTLGADRWLSDTEKLQWHSLNDGLKKNKSTKPDDEDGLVISMRPQQIRTFILKIRSQN